MSSNIITDDQFKHIAKLSRLTIEPKDSVIKDQLSQAAEYVDVLKELETEKINPTYQVNHKKNIFRNDDVLPSFSQKESLSQAKDTSDGYFSTTATIQK